EALTELTRVDPMTGAAGIDEDAGERDQPGEALGADGALRVMTVAVGAGCADVDLGAAPGIEDRCDLGLSGMALDQQLDPVAQPLGALRGADDPRVLAEPEDPGDQLARVRVCRDEHPVAVVPGGAHLAVAAEVALDLPGDPAPDPYLARADRLAELPVDPIR